VSLGRRRDARYEGGRAPRVPICADPSYADKAQKGSTRRAHESTAGLDGFAAVRSYSPIPRPGVAPPAGPRPVFVCSSHVETLAPYAGVVAGTLRRPFAQVELDEHEHGRTSTLRVSARQCRTAIRL